jgi:membrane protease YdiL (CAAX protease family)
VKDRAEHRPGAPRRIWLCYLLAFYALWTLVELLAAPAIIAWLGAGVGALANIIVVKTVIWVAPAVILIHRFSPVLPVPLRKMFTAPVKRLPVLLVFTVLTGWVALTIWGRWPAEGIHLAFPLAGVVRCLFVGIQEELVFRGWLANAMPNWGTWKGYLANGALFALIHVPAWIKDPSRLEGPALIQAPLGLMVFGALLAWLFARGQNITAPIVLHSWYDLLLITMQP